MNQFAFTRTQNGGQHLPKESGLQHQTRPAVLEDGSAAMSLFRTTLASTEFYQLCADENAGPS
jgi:hypothetical protein